MTYLKWLASQVNHSKAQTEELFKLCDNDYGKLKGLFYNMKNCFIYYVPVSKERTEEILNMKPKNHWFQYENEPDDLEL